MSTGDPARPVFPDGSLTKIVYKNFLTYANAVVTPGPNLNLIIGCNGTGKSSIICGICIAVGGNPKSLGRFEKLCDYIKHDCDSGSVEVFIADVKNGQQSVLALLKRPNTIEYHLNGTKVTQTRIKQLAEFYNIQVDNPCAFLAQDKVKSFSEQSAIDLLYNTEKAGDENLYEKHQDLIKRKKQEVDLDHEIKKSESRMQNIDTKEKFLIPRVENFKKKQNMKGRIQLLTKRKTILHFSEAHDEFKKQQKVATKSKQKLEEAESEERQIKERLHGMERNLEATRNKSFKMDQDFKQLSRNVERRVDDSGYENKMASAEAEYQRVRDQCSSFDKNMQDARMLVKDLEIKYDRSQAEMEAMRSRWEEVRLANEKLQNEEQKMDNKENQLNDVARMNNSKIRDCEMRKDRVLLVQRDKAKALYAAPNAAKAWAYVQENPSLFKCPVYCPLIHMSTKSDEESTYLENIIPVRDMSLFVFGCPEDEALLVRRFKINSTIVNPQEVDSSMVNSQLPDELKQFGFRCLASQLFSAPPPLKHYLCKVSFLHRIPIGSAKTDSMYNDVAKVLLRSNISLWFTDSQRCSVKVSKYSGEMISNTSEMRPVRLAAYLSRQTPNTTEIDAEIQKCIKEINDARGELNQIKAQRQQMEVERTQLREKMEVVKKTRMSCMQLKERLKIEKTRLESMQNKRPSISEAKRERDRGRLAATEGFQDKVKGIVTDLKRLKNMSLDMELSQIILCNYTPVMTDLKHELTKVESKLDDVRDANAVCERTLSSIKHQLSSASEELFSVCGIRSAVNKEMKADDKAKWAALQKEFADSDIPEQLDNILKALGEENAKLDMISKDGSHADVVQLEELRKEREELRNVLSEQRDNRDKRDENMRKGIEEWRTPVEKLISNVNENFASFLHYINCDGEVHLDIPDDDLEVDKYGIMINVSFRKGERMRRLDGSKQSGGERSVSTMFYLLSLQEVCPVPFRCVDEINQGMDPTNERKVFEIMVNKLGGSGNLSRTQYFLLTPKLLHDLPYNDKVTVQVVHNSHFLNDDSAEWDHGEFASIISQRARGN